MLLLAILPVVTWLTLACGARDGSLDPAARHASGGSPTAQPPQPNGGSAGSVDLDAAPPLTDEELNRLLDALEQQLDKK